MKQKLTQFAQAVGADIKALNAGKADKSELVAINQAVEALQNREQGVTEQTVIQKITESISQLKSELLGGEGLDETLDTLKELGDKLKELGGNGELSQAITEKLTELKSQIDEAKDVGDLLQTYNEAKGA